MTRFIAFLQGTSDTIADATKIGEQLRSELEALAVRTYPSAGLRVGVEIENPDLWDELSLSADDVAAAVDELSPAAPDHVEEPAIDPIAQQHIDSLAEAIAARGLHAVDSTLEANTAIVARDDIGNGFDAEFNIVDPVATAAPEPPALGEVPVDTTPALPLYTVDGDVNTVNDPAQYPPANVHTPDGRPLFHAAGDEPGGPANADGAGGIWHVYTGETVANTDPTQSTD